MVGWYIDRVDRLRQLSNPLAFLYVTAKVIGGISIGILITAWIETSTWWIFMLVAFIIALPVIWKVFSR